MIWLWYDNAEQNDYTVTQTELSSEGAQQQRLLLRVGKESRPDNLRGYCVSNN